MEESKIIPPHLRVGSIPPHLENPSFDETLPPHLRKSIPPHHLENPSFNDTRPPYERGDKLNESIGAKSGNSDQFEDAKGKNNEDFIIELAEKIDAITVRITKIEVLASADT